MDPAARLELEARRFVEPIESATARGDSEVQQFYKDAVLFITGGTGFIGKQLLEKLFRSCNIKKAFVLVRSKTGKSPNERHREMLSDPVFELVLKKKPDLASRIVCVEGDVGNIQLGISNDDWNMIIEEVDIIFHVAATVRFDENIRTATYINVRGTREALALGKACKKLRSFIHISTAYCHATTYRVGDQVSEQFYSVPVSAETLISLVDENDGTRLDANLKSLINGWPNTYTFTKAVAEELVQNENGNLPVCIVRPSIVLNTYREPVPGWLDISCMFGPSGIAIGVGLGVLRVVLVNNNLKLAFVPVDYVNNAIIAAGWQAGIRRLQESLIYNVSTTGCGVTFRNVSEPMRKYDNELVTPLAMWYCYLIETNNRVFYYFLSWILHYIPAYILDAAIKIFKIKKPKQLKSFVHLYTKYDKLCGVFSFFLTHEWHFDDTNLQQLWRAMSPTDRTIYNFDMRTIDWDHYTIMWCIGIRKYIVKDSLKGTKKAAARQKWLKLANFAVGATYVALTWVVVNWLWYLASMIF